MARNWGLYFKPGKDAYISFNPKSLHNVFADIFQENS
jgi:hypothetical protein